MPIIKLHFDLPTMTKKRPRAGKNGVYNDPVYTRWKEDAVYLAAIQVEQRKLRTQLMYFEFGLSDLGVDPDNTEGAILDGITQAKILVSDTFKSIPVHLTVGFPVKPGAEYCKVFFVHDGTKQEHKKFIEFMNAAIHKRLTLTSTI